MLCHASHIVSTLAAAAVNTHTERHDVPWLSCHAAGLLFCRLFSPSCPGLHGTAAIDSDLPGM